LLDRLLTALTNPETRRPHFGRAIFRGARFTEGARFANVRFDGEVDFRAARFSGDTSFEGAQFNEIARFGSQSPYACAQFEGGADFDEATFGAIADFRGAQFGFWTRVRGFSGKIRLGDARFVGAKFKQDAWFNGVTFNGH
ncbi:pentapeptide repeat-containing protein, partial [Nonomuraea sp. RK-328]|nr:pentapeptide repeat-containing protein [Nonomuraea sp. RK-328]